MSLFQVNSSLVTIASSVLSDVATVVSSLLTYSTSTIASAYGSVSDGALTAQYVSWFASNRATELESDAEQVIGLMHSDILPT